MKYFLEPITVKKKKVKGWKDGRFYFPSSCAKALSLASKCAVTAAWLHTWLQASTVSVWFYFEKIRLRPRCFVWTAGIRTSVVQGFPSSCCWLTCFFFAIIKDAVVWHRIYCRGKCTEKSHFSKLFFLNYCLRSLTFDFILPKRLYYLLQFVSLRLPFCRKSVPWDSSEKWLWFTVSRSSN